MKVTVQDIVNRFETYCPVEMAEKGDPVGLQIGDRKQVVNKIMITLDIRPETVSEAIENHVDFILAKHPILFRPAKTLLEEDPQQKMYRDLVKNNINVYIAHTNLDIIENGLNDWFCELLGISNSTYLTKTGEISYKKLTVFVPKDSAESLRKALAEAGAGKIGENYQEASFSTEGKSRFMPIHTAKPAIGRLNQLELVDEERIEVIFSEYNEKNIVQSLLEHHPYEVPAYEIYPIENYKVEYGLGRIGILTKPTTLADFANLIKDVFRLDNLRLITHNENQVIKKVAICGGSGEKFYKDALKKDADLYITGDVYYHTAHDMLAEGLSVIDPGHYIEALCIPRLVKMFTQWKEKEKWTIEIVGSTVNTDPFQYY